MDAPIRESDARMSDVSDFRRNEQSTSKDALSNTRHSGNIENAAGISGFRGEENRQMDTSSGNRTLFEILKVIQELKDRLWNGTCQVKDNLAADASKVARLVLGFSGLPSSKGTAIGFLVMRSDLQSKN